MNRDLARVGLYGHPMACPYTGGTPVALPLPLLHRQRDGGGVRQRAGGAGDGHRIALHLLSKETVATPAAGRKAQRGAGQRQRQQHAGESRRPPSRPAHASAQGQQEDSSHHHQGKAASQGIGGIARQDRGAAHEGGDL